MEKIKEANEKNLKIVEKHKKITAQIKQCEQKQNEVNKLLNEMNVQFKGKEQQQLKSQVNAFLQQDLDKLSQTKQGIYLFNANKLISQMKNALGNKIQNQKNNNKSNKIQNQKNNNKSNKIQNKKNNN